MSEHGENGLLRSKHYIQLRHIIPVINARENWPFYATVRPVTTGQRYLTCV